MPYETTWLVAWSDLDRAAAIAWMARDADRCPGCGLHHSDTPADRRDLVFSGEYQYCSGCEAKALVPTPEGDQAKWRHFRWVLRRGDEPQRSASRRRR